jgi:hypothetical protein
MAVAMCVLAVTVVSPAAGNISVLPHTFGVATASAWASSCGDDPAVCEAEKGKEAGEWATYQCMAAGGGAGECGEAGSSAFAAAAIAVWSYNRAKKCQQDPYCVNAGKASHLILPLP